VALTDAQFRRYLRHVLLADVGAAGQERLLAATVRVELPEPPSGAAVTAIAYLASAGVGRIWIGGAGAEAVSADDVASGLLYGADDVGRRRLDALRERVAALNPEVAIVAPPDGGRADEVLVGAPDPRARRSRWPTRSSLAGSPPPRCWRGSPAARRR
jgi:adenylyltransferase/sulfurtransferase